MVAFQRVWRHLKGEEIFVGDNKPYLGGFYFLALRVGETRQSSVLDLFPVNPG